MNMLVRRAIDKVAPMREPSEKAKAKGGMRRKLMRRDGKRCVICGVEVLTRYEDRGRAEYATLHCRIPPSQGGSHTETENLEIWCQACTTDPTRRQAHLVTAALQTEARELRRIGEGGHRILELILDSEASYTPGEYSD